MEKLISKASLNHCFSCCGKFWFALLISSLMCFILFSFEYIALTGFNNGVVSDFPNSNPNQNSISLNPIQTPVVKRTTQKQSAMDDDPTCSGRYVYIHKIPSRFNIDLLKNCHLLTPGTDKNMCPFLVNNGFGPQIDENSDLINNKTWFSTNQFLLEVIFHNKMKNYKCLTNDSSLASAIYVPFYAGLDLGRRLWGGFNISVRDSSGVDLLKWLTKQQQWRKMLGRDHFLTAGRISWDFRRQTDEESDWGSKFRFLPESKNMSMLSIESSSWNNDYAIPYPTCFHPSKLSEITQWQNNLRNHERRFLFSFAGAPRPEYRDSIRGNLINQCLDSKNQCKLLNCDYGATNCNNPVNVMKVFTNSVFCLQPVGDSYTRRSIFDSVLAGCIPVFFHPGTAFAQYKWHLPKNFTNYSVYIPVKDVEDLKGKNINETLLEISMDRVVALREEVLGLIPRIVYSKPESRVGLFEDAFDLSVKGILERIENVRNEIRDGNDPGIGFADPDDFKYTFSYYEDRT